MLIALMLTAQMLGLLAYAIFMSHVERRRPNHPWRWFAGATLAAFIYQVTFVWLVLRSL